MSWAFQPLAPAAAQVQSGPTGIGTTFSVPAPSWTWDYSPSTHHVKAGEFAVPAPKWTWDYSPSTHHVQPAPEIAFEVALGDPGGLLLLLPSGSIQGLPNYEDPDTFYSHEITTSNLLSPGFYTDPDTFYSALFTLNIYLPLYDDADTFYQHSLVRGNGAGQVTRYVTVEFDGVRRVNISRDIVNYESHKDHVRFTKVAYTDKIVYAAKNSSIFYSK